jgi:hypothetical protein
VSEEASKAKETGILARRPGWGEQVFDSTNVGRCDVRIVVSDDFEDLSVVDERRSLDWRQGGHLVYSAAIATRSDNVYYVTQAMGVPIAGKRHKFFCCKR